MKVCESLGEGIGGSPWPAVGGARPLNGLAAPLPSQQQQQQQQFATMADCIIFCPHTIVFHRGKIIDIHKNN